MNQKDLFYIKTIADEGSLSQAAKKLFLSQPSLSQTLKRIESDLGAPLFIRTPRGLSLTELGKEYYRTASRILSLIKEFEERTMEYKSLDCGSLSIGITSHRGLFLLPKFMANFHLKYPGITVKLTETSARELEQLVQQGVLDFALMRQESPEHPVPSLVYEGLLQESFLLLLPSGHPAKEKAMTVPGLSFPVLDPRYLADETFLLPDASYRLRDMMMDVLKRAGIANPQRTESTYYLETLFYLTEAGKGVTFMPSHYFRDHVNSLSVDCYYIPESYGVFWDICLVRLKDNPQSLAAEAFIRELKNHLGI